MLLIYVLMEKKKKKYFMLAALGLRSSAAVLFKVELDDI